MFCENQKYVIGVDGGGSKTIAVLADLKGKVLKEVKTGPSNFIKDGIKETVLNITKAIEEILKKDKIAKEILVEAGKELALTGKTAIKKLILSHRARFSLVLTGGMFKSKIILDTVKKEIKKFAPKVQFIRPKQEPVMGAVKLALGCLKLKK